MKTKAVKSKGRKLLRLSVLIIAVALVSLWVSVSYSQALEYFEDWGWVGNNTGDTSYPSTIG